VQAKGLLYKADHSSRIQRLRYLLGHKTTVTAICLYLVHFLNYLLPALTVALLTRRFNPSTYGRLIIAQSLGLTVSTFAEYGFQWTGSRAVAERALDEDLGSVVVSVGAAKLLIAAACVVLVPIYAVLIPAMSGYVWLVFSGYIWGVIQGTDFQWYFMGREKLRGYLTVDSLLRALAVLLILLTIRDDRDVSKVLVIQSACTLVLSLWAAWRVAREVRLVRPTRTGVMEALRDGRTLFFQRLAGYAASSVNVALLGIVATPAAVGFFGSADKIVRYSSSLNVPVTQILYPKISRTMATAGGDVTRLARLAGGVSLAMACIVSLAIFTMPRTIILVLFGPKMLPALPTLRILAVFPILNSLTSSLLFYWILPKRMESVSLRVIVCSGVVNIVSIVLFGRVWHQAGAGAAVVLTEAVTLAGYLLALRLSSTREFRSSKFTPLAERVS
jgi:PST family polysaccharide transporter